MMTNDSNDRNSKLTAALRALAEDDSKLGTSPDVEKRLLLEVRAISRARHRTRLGVFSIAAALLIGIVLYVWRIGNRQPSDIVESRSAREEVIAEVATEFLPLP